MSRIDSIGQNGNEGLNYGTVYDTVHLDYNLHEYTPTIETEVQDKCSGCMSLCEGCEPQIFDQVNHPKHYTSHPSGIECIQITEHMDFLLGNALKYIWRADLKQNRKQDLEKALWYLQRALDRE